jgi:tetratricopeptide (TPR) repeat protein
MSAHPSFLRNSLRISVIGVALAAQAAAQATQSAAPSPAMRLLDSSRVLIARATPIGDVATLHAAQALLERALTVAPNDPWLLHYLGFALYREATLRMGRDDQDAVPLLERADSILQRSILSMPIAESHALRSAALGMMIGSNPIRGMTLGPRSGTQMERAFELAPNNPRVWLVSGIGAMNTPAMFGGGLGKAEEHLKKAIDLYRTDRPQAPHPDWGEAEAHVWLGRVYGKQGKKDLARAEYQKALAIEPNDMWTRTILLPALDRSQ